MSDHHDEQVRKYLYHGTEYLELIADRLEHLAESSLGLWKETERCGDMLERIAKALEAIQE